MRINMRRLAVLISLMLSLVILDSWITHIVLTRLPESRELNPFVDTTDFTSILTSPLPWISLLFSVSGLLYAEKFSTDINRMCNDWSPWLLPALLPWYLILVVTLACINNVMLIYFNISPITTALAPIRSVVSNPHIQMLTLFSLMFLLFLPGGRQVLRMIYR